MGARLVEQSSQAFPFSTAWEGKRILKVL
jgi:hypothetical protein